MNRKAITILEMMISASLVVIIILTGAVVFSQAVKAQRASTQTFSIMDKLQTTGQVLGGDLDKIVKDAPFAIWFDSTGNARMTFFATGNFEGYAYNSYGDDAAKITGDTARIVIAFDEKSGYLIRQVNILDQFQYDLNTIDEDPFPVYGGVPLEESVLRDSYIQGYDSISLSRWRSLLQDTDNAYQYLSYLVNFDTIFDVNRTEVQFNNKFWPMLMSDNVSSFEIQIGLGADVDRVSSTDKPKIIRWYPDDNPYTTHSGNDSDFNAMNEDPDGAFGIYFNMPNVVGASDLDFYMPGENDLKRTILSGASAVEEVIPEGFLPVAIKLSFTFSDNSETLNEDTTFSHVIYLD